jgi:hypothetical protein
MISMLAGLALLVVSVRLSTPNLALFLIGGALIGAGSGQPTRCATPPARAWRFTGWTPMRFAAAASCR